MVDKETLRKNKLLQELFETCLYDEPGTHWRGYADEDPDDEGPDEDDESKAEWNESDHPREPAGSSEGGQFTDGDGAAPIDKNPTPAGKPVTKERLEELAAELKKYKVKAKNLGESKDRPRTEKELLLLAALEGCERMRDAGFNFQRNNQVILDLNPPKSVLARSSTLASFHPFDRSITFSRESVAELDARVKKGWIAEVTGQHSPFHAAGRLGVTGIFIHEYGHSVDEKLSKEPFGIGVSADLPIAYTDATKGHASSLSRYATTNSAEFFAESFSVVFSNDKLVTDRMPTKGLQAIHRKFEGAGLIRQTRRSD